METGRDFSIVMKKIKKGLDDPPYNFYLHTAPCDGKNIHFITGTGQYCQKLQSRQVLN